MRKRQHTITELFGDLPTWMLAAAIPLVSRMVPASSTPAGQLIGHQEPNSASAVDFTGLSSEFMFYWVIGHIDTSDAADQFLRCQINGDSTSGHYLWGLSDGQSSASDSSVVFGWIPTSGQAFGTIAAYIPVRHGGNTRSGMSQYAVQGAGTRNGTGYQNYSFSISNATSSIHLFAGAGNLTGYISLYGIM